MFGAPNPSYTFGPPPREVHRVTTSLTELLHLGIALAVLTFDIAVLQLNLGLGRFDTSAAGVEFAAGFGLAAALTGFLSHELAHKVAAQRLGLWAEFRASAIGLVLSVVTSLLGFLFAAPGATMVDGYGSPSEWGRISLAGPATNIVFAVSFLSIAEYLSTIPTALLAASTFGLLAFFNGWFGTFNLIPFGPLDGRKVFRWSPLLWAGSIVLAGLLAFVSFAFLFLPNLI